MGSIDPSFLHMASILDFLRSLFKLIFALAGTDRRPVLEAFSKGGRLDRDKRRQSAEKQKSTKDSEKKKEKKKNLDRQALEARRAKSRQRGEPEEESPNEDDGGDGDDDSDDSEGTASRLDRILEGSPQGDVDALRMGAPKDGPGESLERQQRES